MDKIYRVRQGMGGRYVVERDNALYWLEGDVFGDYRTGAGIDEPLRDFLSPVMPSKIMAIGLNYKDHAAEMKKPLPAEPLLFIKPAHDGDWPRGEHPHSVVGRPHRARSRDGASSSAAAPRG